MIENIKTVPEPDKNLMLRALRARHTQRGAKSIIELLADRAAKQTALFSEQFDQKAESARASFANALLAFFENWAFAKAKYLADVVSKKIAVCKRNDFLLSQIGFYV